MKQHNTNYKKAMKILLQDCAFDSCAQNNSDLAVNQTIDRLIEECYVNGFNCSDTCPGQSENNWKRAR